MRSTSRDAKGGGRTIRGSVTGAGAISGGVGFSVVRTAAGNYTITFLVPFASSYVPQANAYGLGIVANAYLGPTPNSFRVITTVENTSAQTDSDFGFVAMELER